ncbi:MAG: tRNA (adenosine(37)-N6)-threonylcarbamoyltransferase complex transferase subunit TsaD [Bacteroidetes bacterium GWC2_33_15]|nr:MAG: tRNA (adenosine(37)-N6)-threonylcarbamoyltransferase complex transferase subunit TsaD [Bacteroidetes bacterium GWA2_33_15]OFX50050.1 MAG: tRNA (adenosine(37)-N6)-threonylcarbamoyltransferase complex transferase subunit TsaD [Bacteroidetes bacterium GWC2_33_15]OFX65203.1 MAG: tRNA (adenosine(37)-N6)-threonylcarbamoyltransferase complex transferase subunit TsaD [Bacteroidetes bacterium GWB2_32_14]OFX70429.1 MAG: tRNA (adenosine(37)-N6)-threonylcarbamoyltransferase complex transferase subun
MSITILGIESSCDDTSAAIIQDGFLLSNVIANQDVHKKFGGVVPELASRAHQQNIIPVVDLAIKQAGVKKSDINAVAFTRGPGLLGSLLVGTSFSKSFALALNIPLVEVNHLQAHMLVHFIKEKNKENQIPEFPFLCLLVSGGHTQLVKINNYLDMEIVGQTIDDAAGEAFDKCAKVIGLPYPGGPVIDKNAQLGNINAFTFSKPRIKEYDYSFSGLKTSFLYFIRDRIKENSGFVKQNMNDLCASIQHTVVEILMDKLIAVSKKTGIKTIAIAGGVSANSGLRNAILESAKKYQWETFIPDFKYTTDNAAMIAITGYYKYLNKDFANQDIAPLARFKY